MIKVDRVVWSIRGAIAVVILLLIVVWQSQQQKTQQPLVSNNSNNEKPIEAPDYDMQQITAYQFSKTGKMQYVFSASKATQLIAQEEIFLTEPQLVIYSKTQSIPWKLTSQSGKVINDGGQIDMWDQVHLARMTDLSDEKMDVKTDALTFFPDREWAQTDKPVVISTTFDQTTGVGMEADLSKKELHLLSHVKGTHRTHN